MERTPARPAHRRRSQERRWAGHGLRELERRHQRLALAGPRRRHPRRDEAAPNRRAGGVRDWGRAENRCKVLQRRRDRPIRHRGDIRNRGLGLGAELV